MTTQNTKRYMMPLFAFVFFIMLSGARAAEPLWTVPFGAKGIYFSEESKYLAGYNETDTWMFDVSDGKIIFKLPGEIIPRFTPDGKYLTTAKDSMIIRRSVGDWKIIDTIRFDFPVTNVYEFSPDGTKLAIAHNQTPNDRDGDFYYYIYDTKNWKVILEKNVVKMSVNTYVEALEFSFSRDNYLLSIVFFQKYVNSSSYYYINHITDLRSNKQVGAIGEYKQNGNGGCRYVKFSPTEDKVFAIALYLTGPYGKQESNFGHVCMIPYDVNNLKDSNRIRSNDEGYQTSRKLFTFDCIADKAKKDYRMTISPNGDRVINALVNTGICYFDTKDLKKETTILDLNTSKDVPHFPKVSQDSKYFAIYLNSSIYMYNYDDKLISSVHSTPESTIKIKTDSKSNELIIENTDEAVKLLSYSIFDLSGKQLIPYTSLDELGNSIIALPISFLSNGTYILSIKTNKEFQSVKFNVTR